MSKEMKLDQQTGCPLSHRQEPQAEEKVGIKLRHFGGDINEHAAGKHFLQGWSLRNVQLLYNCF